MSPGSSAPSMHNMSPRNSRQSTSSSSSTVRSLSNPNIFSDEFALEPLNPVSKSPFETDDDVSPVSPVQPSPSSSISRPITPGSSIDPIHTRSAPSGPVSSDIDSLSPTRVVSRTSNVTDIHRASSTSSHFSFPRSQSPYVGATGPSHPYGMYPQGTRASSVASASTVRPVERTIGASAPEHPYALYSQGVPEEDDDDDPATQVIPLGFPRLGGQYQHVPSSRPNDVADIIGSDGHIEQLPPYSRYEDAIVSKGGSSSSTGQVASASSVEPEQVPLTPPSAPVAAHTAPSEVTRDVEPAPSSSEENCSSIGFTEKIKQRSKRKMCCGIPFGLILVILIVLLFGVIIGAVIGGVVGSKKGNTTNPAEGVYETAAPVATITVSEYIDGSPLPTTHPVPAVPNGKYRIPTENPGIYSSGCIKDDAMAAAWACMPPYGLGITVRGQDFDVRMSLDPYPIKEDFIYGAQPPDIFPDWIDLVPSTDKDSNDFGPSLFAWAFYNKLTILHEDAFTPQDNEKRHAPPIRGAVGHRPWFCWFNETVVEFFIYFNKTDPDSATSSSSPLASLSPSVASAVSSAASTYLARRGSETGLPINPNPDYPLPIKLEEKRKPAETVPPYCQQMQVLYDRRVVKTGTDVIYIEELPSTEDSVVKRDDARRREVDRVGKQKDKRDFVSEEEEFVEEYKEGNCKCEWITG